MSPNSSPSPTLTRLGLATPPPFVGRHKELAKLTSALHEFPLLVLSGAVGAGKTRLAAELARRVRSQEKDSFLVTRIACVPGDLGVAVIGRCERATNSLPGSLGSMLHKEAHLIIVDDVHHLPSVDVLELVRTVTDRPGAGRILLLTRDILPLPRADARQFSSTLEGLDEPSARSLWSHLEDLYGPTSPDACDAALGKTRGMPLAMRRDYARRRYGNDAWELDAIPAKARAALEAVCVGRLAMAPAAISSLLGDQTNPEDALIDLVSRQLIDPLESGRFAVHDVVRDQVLAALAPELRKTLEIRAATLVRGLGRGNGPIRPAWIAGDDGAMVMQDPVDRSREIIAHLIEGDECETAVDELVACTRGALARGAAGELLAHTEKLRSIGHTDERISTVEAWIAIRQGRFADALALGTRLDAPTRAFLHFRTGDITGARSMLVALEEHEDAEVRAQGAAILAELELASGEVANAQRCLSKSFEDRASLSGAARASLHLAFAQLESHRGDLSAARAALSRAASNADDGELLARVLVARVRNMIEESRFREARALREQAELAVREADSVPLRDELARLAALAACSVGDACEAGETLRTVIAVARLRGDEIGALRADLELAQSRVSVGELGAAAESAAAAGRTAKRYGLRSMAAQADLIRIQVGLAELHIDSVSELLCEIDAASLPHTDTERLESVQRAVGATKGLETDDNATDSDLEHALLALARGNSAGALRAARRASTQADRLGHSRVLALSLAMVARLELSRGQCKAAGEAAARAARESQASACTDAQIQSLLVLSALARDTGSIRDGATYARDARELAVQAASPVLRLVACAALDVIAQDGNGFETTSPNASAATASLWARKAADAMLADLGFSAARPYRCVNGAGAESFVTSASPELLGMSERSLSIDAVRQVIVRDGEIVADLRRRSLLKRLLFLFAAAPGSVYSKEEIVEKVWEVEYHPLRHDAALFTNIMRIRRLLSDDKNELIVVSEDGYTMAPPADFLYVEAVSQTGSAP